MAQPPEFTVTTLPEWLELPEVAVPTLRDAFQKGAIFTVHKIGFLGVPVAECSEAGITGEMTVLAGKRILPTVVIEFDGDSQLHRLPTVFGMWALHSVEMANDLHRVLPTRFEFGILQGRAFAEMG